MSFVSNGSTTEWYIGTGLADHFVYLRVFNGTQKGMTQISVTKEDVTARVNLTPEVAKALLESLKAAIEKAESEANANK